MSTEPKARPVVPIEVDTTPVRVLGEEVSPIFWRGRQWAVTEYGIEALDGRYPIEAASLRDGMGEWSWIRQMGAKNWVDMPDFATAFAVALVLHGRAGPQDGAHILNDFRKVALRRPDHEE